MDAVSQARQNGRIVNNWQFGTNSPAEVLFQAKPQRPSGASSRGLISVAGLGVGLEPAAHVLEGWRGSRPGAVSSADVAAAGSNGAEARGVGRCVSGQVGKEKPV